MANKEQVEQSAKTNPIKKVQKGKVQKYDISDVDLYGVIRKADELMDKAGISHPEEGREYEQLSVPDTIQDVLQSVWTEASRIFYPKDKEPDYESRTRIGDISKYSYRNGAPMLLGGQSLKKILPRLLTSIFRYKTNKEKSDNNISESNKPNEQQTNPKTNEGIQKHPFGSLTRQGRNNQTPQNKGQEPISEPVKEPTGEKPPREEYPNTQSKEPIRSKYEEAERARIEKIRKEKDAEDLEQQINPKDNKIFDQKGYNPESDTAIAEAPDFTPEELGHMRDYSYMLAEKFDENDKTACAEISNSPVYQEIRRLAQYDFSPLSTNNFISTVEVNFDDFKSRDVSARDLLQDELAITKIYGKSLKETLSDMITSERYQSLPDYSTEISEHSKVDLMNYTIAQYNIKAKSHIIRTNNTLLNSQGLTMMDERIRVSNEKYKRDLFQRLAHAREVRRSMGAII